NYTPHLQYLARGKNLVALRVATEHSAQHAACDCKIRRAKENPGDAHGDKGGASTYCPADRIVKPPTLGATNPHHAFNDQIRAVKQAPDHKRPRCAVPQTSKKHDDDKVGSRAHRPHLVAAEGNVKVIAQEGGK